MAALLTIGGSPLVELRPDFRIAGVDADGVTRLRVDEPNDAEVGKLLLARVLDADGDEVVPLREELERPLDVLAEKIRHEKDDRLVREHLDQVIGRTRDVGARSFRLEDEQVANEAERVFASLSRRQYVLDVIGEEQCAD